MELAQRAVTLLEAGEASGREEGYSLLQELCNTAPCMEGETAAAAAQTIPALGKILCADVSEVCPAEFQRASCLLTTLQLQAHADGRVSGQYLLVWDSISMAPNNAIVQCLNKGADSLTREDLLTAGSVCAPVAAAFAKGITNSLATLPDPPHESVIIAGYINNPVGKATSHSRGKVPDQQSLAIVRRALALLKAEPDLPNLDKSGLWCLIWLSCANRPGIALQILEEALPVVMSVISSSSPSQWLNVSKADKFMYNAVFSVVKDSADAYDGDVVPMLLSSGYLAACVQMLRTFEAEAGPQKDHNVMSIFFGALWNLASLDFSQSPDALAMLRGAAAPLRYAMDHEMPQLGQLGMTNRLFACLVAANLFGRDEDGDGPLKLTQEDVGHTLVYFSELNKPTIGWGAIFPLPPGTVMRNLCISDTHKQLLLDHEISFIQHCVDGLLLDPDVRADAAPSLRATAQRSYAEVFQQIVLFEPGRNYSTSSIIDSYITSHKS